MAHRKGEPMHPNTRAALLKANIGNKSNLGVKWSEERKRKHSEMAKSKGYGKWMKGKKVAPETIAKRIAIYADPEFKKRQKESHTGERASAWKGGLSKDYAYQLMRAQVKGSRKRARLYKTTGNFTVDDWIKLKKAYKNTCPSCLRREPEINLSIDHIVPFRVGGTNDISNIQPLCFNCNSMKYNKVYKFDDNIPDRLDPSA